MKDKFAIEHPVFLECADFGKRGCAKPSHYGGNLHNMKAIAGQDAVKAIVNECGTMVETFFMQKPRGTLNIVCICVQGRHRSVTGACLLAGLLSRLDKFEVDGPVHLSRATWWTRMCTKCPDCLDSPAKDDLIDSIEKLW